LKAKTPGFGGGLLLKAKTPGFAGGLLLAFDNTVIFWTDMHTRRQNK